MSRLEQFFADLRREGKSALAPFVCAGDPTAPSLAELLGALETGGAGMVEIGFPYSDPIADGPVVASAMERALAGGWTPERVFAAVAEARAGTAMPLVAMASVSLLWRAGVEAFIARAAAAGLDGVIVPDLTLEEFRATNALVDPPIPIVLLVAPTTPPERAALIASASRGMVYLIARAGITGASAGTPEIAEPVAGIRAETDRPIACGFGISTAEHVAQVTAHADAAIVGSALVDLMAESARRTGAACDVSVPRAFIESLAGGLAGR